MSFGSYRWWGGIALALLLLFSVAGCNEYKTFTLEKGIAHFTFEYPSSYQTPSVHIMYDYRETQVSIGRCPPENHRNEILLYIRTYHYDEYNAESWLESYLGSESSLSDNFTLLRRLPMKVGTDTGEHAVYSYVQYQLDFKAVPTIVRIVAFDHDDLIFHISVSADMGISESAKADFDHIIKTFEILD
jgi:hypothetical protein